MAEELHVMNIPGIVQVTVDMVQVTVDMAEIPARFKKQTVKGLRELCDEARDAFIDEVFVLFNFSSYCVTVILEG